MDIFLEKEFTEFFPQMLNVVYDDPPQELLLKKCSTNKSTMKHH